ncbi:uncharacterized protein LOC125178892 [Hyalella azteca]|uniref:Uncharacterized protein LOC125178892 n=1 Tax=Hyalella azteca TaxID=294128 RepID=A0A979FUC8_HYAAZ|nr:uncharacterized protein LOC125178892 [Hyalella azteca]
MLRQHTDMRRRYHDARAKCEDVLLDIESPAVSTQALEKLHVVISQLEESRAQVDVLEKQLRKVCREVRSLWTPAAVAVGRAWRALERVQEFVKRRHRFALPSVVPDLQLFVDIFVVRARQNLGKDSADNHRSVIWSSLWEAVEPRLHEDSRQLTRCCLLVSALKDQLDDELTSSDIDSDVSELRVGSEEKSTNNENEINQHSADNHRSVIWSSLWEAVEPRLHEDSRQLTRCCLLVSALKDQLDDELTSSDIDSDVSELRMGSEEKLTNGENEINERKSQPSIDSKEIDEFISGSLEKVLSEVDYIVDKKRVDDDLQGFHLSNITGEQRKKLLRSVSFSQPANRLPRLSKKHSSLPLDFQLSSSQESPRPSSSCPNSVYLQDYKSSFSSPLECKTFSEVVAEEAMSALLDDGIAYHALAFQDFYDKITNSEKAITLQHKACEQAIDFLLVKCPTIFALSLDTNTTGQQKLQPNSSRDDYEKIEADGEYSPQRRKFVKLVENILINDRSLDEDALQDLFYDRHHLIKDLRMLLLFHVLCHRDLENWTSRLLAKVVPELSVPDRGPEEKIAASLLQRRQLSRCSAVEPQRDALLQIWCGDEHADVVALVRSALRRLGVPYYKTWFKPAPDLLHFQVLLKTL